METLNLDKSVVIESPKDEILTGIVIETNKTSWREIIDPEKLNKFESPDDVIVQIKYECQFKGNTLKSEETMKFYEKPMSNSKLGRFLIKYDTLKPATEIKVIFDGKGIPSIKLD